MTNTLLGNDAEAQRDRSRAVDRGYNPTQLIDAIEILKRQP